jgi:hypothetical protein
MRLALLVQAEAALLGQALQRSFGRFRAVEVGVCEQARRLRMQQGMSIPDKVSTLNTRQRKRADPERAYISTHEQNTRALLPCCHVHPIRHFTHNCKYIRTCADPGS